MRSLLFSGSVLAATLFPAVVPAAVVQVRVTAENLAPANSVAFAPLRLGFNNGTFDSFNINQQPGAAIISIAEGGSGSDWFPAFALSEPIAVLGTVVPNPPGPLVPGASASSIFTIDTAINPFFTFGSMVVPSNDVFIGNDSPMQYRVFDAAGNLLINNILQDASDIWDAGSEVTDPANAAFLVGGINGNRIADNGNVVFDFTGLNAFNGLTTGAGYVFNSQLTPNLDIYRITFDVVPEPSTYALFGIGSLGLLAARLWRKRQVKLIAAE